MFPLRDTNKSKTFPATNWLIIMANIGVFVMQSGLSNEETKILHHTLGVVPANFLSGHPLAAISLLSYQFLHGGFWHLVSNMWFLYIFGDNVEDRMGHTRYFMFYLLSGVSGGLLQILLGQTATSPMIGASGAVAGILGAYLILFPRARVVTFVPIFFLPWLVKIPAVIYLGLYFISQFSNALTGLSMAAGGGIAYWAHVGGFLAGFALVRRFSRRIEIVQFQPPS